jgi:RNA polymerase sigma-70 factor (ECF subfamily)
MNEQALLAAARVGDEGAFAALMSPYRGELTAHCYRMLGSVQDAEDALQEALLRAWRALGRFEGRSSLRSWLYTIATNVCLRAIERRPNRVLPIDYGPATADPHAYTGEPIVESVWLEPYPDPETGYEQREGIELAFIAALQHLPAQQRAVLILRDVLGFSGAETAEMLEVSPDAVYSALQRAHKTVDERLPAQTQQATLDAVGDDRLRALVEGYVDAWERADIHALAAKLAEDAVLAMPPYPNWYRGREAIATFLVERPLSGDERWRVIPTRANGQLAFAHYGWDDDAEAFVAHGIAVIALEDDRISDLTIFRDPEHVARFGLPERLGHR